MAGFRLVGLTLALGLGAAPGAAAEEFAVARPTLELEGKRVERGVVFFVSARVPAGAAAVGTAHTFELTDFARSQRVEFRAGRSGEPLASSRGLLASPGRAFDSPGAHLRDDFLIFALEAAPQGVRLLELARDPELPAGTEVQVLGLDRKRDEPRTLRGRIARAGSAEIEVEVDGAPDLEGWGGAPVVTRDGRVVGMLQARWRRGATSRLAVAPLDGLLAALGRPLAGGNGRSFEHLVDAGALPDSPTVTLEPREEPVPPPPTEIRLSVEYPSWDSGVEDSGCGVFVAGRALAHELAQARFDVALVIDTSESTREASGADIDGDGTVGRPRLGPIGSLFFDGITDPDDSVLAAEVAASRQLLFGLDPRSTRVAVITFAGDTPSAIPGWLRGAGPSAVVREPLTSDHGRVDRALGNIQSRAPAGATDMAAGLDLATLELSGGNGARSDPDPDSEKIVFFFTDGKPTLPHPGFEADNVRAVLRAADRSRLDRVRVHSFAIGSEALEGPIAAMEMAQRTGGFFTPVRHPGSLKAAVERVSFANVESVSLRNASTGQHATTLRTTADGTWAGFVPAKTGSNRLEIVARAADGAEARASLKVRLGESVPLAPVPAELAARRNHLLEQCLLEAKRSRAEIEAAQAEAMRRDLALEIERERAAARERAEQQRKDLELGVDPE